MNTSSSESVVYELKVEEHITVRIDELTKLLTERAQLMEQNTELQARMTKMIEEHRSKVVLET